MTHGIFNVVRSIHTPQGHAQRMKILVNLKKSKYKYIDLNNKRILIATTTCILIPNISFSEIPSTLFDQ